ncbi:uncharacterized protein MYCFIDRAFT_180358 [Pseudocercospora fijiensis CIRAD86]|uniref:Uncharacterized protein n=1 Tax=Pseudocercospora fijiensis (strain CIRAD86) TaxID=383855 RepID=M3AHN5_PSEFD|nr:uncharacterized protein MYCFIDRAFT_180358 [Pseudocercospora fijiensis CIRAD86]EME77027.1 hypothetical protein MYCFIDRAFT_180358 [Pseudocercospora fijiensis CIRAD86]
MRYRHAALYHNLEAALYAMPLKPNTSYLVRPNLATLEHFARYVTPLDSPSRFPAPDDVEHTSTDFMFIYCTGSDAREGGHIHECDCSQIVPFGGECRNSNLKAVQQRRIQRRKQFLQVEEQAGELGQDQEHDQERDRERDRERDQDQAQEPAARAGARKRKRQAPEPLSKQATKRAATLARHTSRRTVLLPRPDTATRSAKRRRACPSTQNQASPDSLARPPHMSLFTPEPLPCLRFTRDSSCSANIDASRSNRHAIPSAPSGLYQQLRDDHAPPQLPTSVRPSGPSNVLESGNVYCYPDRPSVLTAHGTPHTSTSAACTDLNGTPFPSPYYASPPFHCQPSAAAFPVAEPAHIFSATNLRTSAGSFPDLSFGTGNGEAAGTPPTVTATNLVPDLPCGFGNGEARGPTATEKYGMEQVPKSWGSET